MTTGYAENARNVRMCAKDMYLLFLDTACKVQWPSDQVAPQNTKMLGIQKSEQIAVTCVVICVEVWGRKI